MTAVLLKTDESCSEEKCGKLRPNGMCRPHYTRAWRKANAEHLKAAKRKWYEENRELTIQRSRARALADPEREAEYKRRWNEENAEHKKLLDQTWRANNPERYLLNGRASRARRRARLANAPVCDFTLKDWRELLDEYQGRCAYCGVERDDLHQEHKIPIVRGGAHTKSNVVPACPPCNLRKGTLTDEEFQGGNRLRALLIPKETDG